MPWLDDDQLGALVRQVVQVAVAEAREQVRVPATLTGTVEDVDGDTFDVAYIRLDSQAMSSDPTQSDNWGTPGIIPVTRTGETTVDEQVLVAFESAAGVASAIRTGFAGVEHRVDIDSTQGVVSFLLDNVVVGLLDATRWEIGIPGESLARLDPLGGLRLRDGNDVLRAQLSASEGLILREAGSGISSVILSADGLIVLDPDTGEQISIQHGTSGGTPTPRWLGSADETTPGSSHPTPAPVLFGADDIIVRWVCASADTSLGAQSYTPPSGYTERSDVNDSANDLTLATSGATKDPATTDGVQSFDNTSAAWDRINGHEVVVRGGGSTSVAFRSATVEPVIESSAIRIDLDVNLPPGVVDGDMAVVFVGITSTQIPIGWTVPDGWKQLGIQVAGLGTSHILASACFYKRIGPSEPDPQHVTINMAAAGHTKVQLTAYAFSNPYAFPAGLDIRRNNRSMPRGIEAQVIETDNTGVFSTSGNIDLDTITVAPNGVPMIAGRTYEFQLLLPSVVYSSLEGGSQWQIRLLKDSTTAIGVFAVIEYPFTGVARVPVNGSFEYIPAANESARWTVRFEEISGNSTLQATATTTAPRRLDILDMGGTF